jgi:hypothetical protein
MDDVIRRELGKGSSLHIAPFLSYPQAVLRWVIIRLLPPSREQADAGTLGSSQVQANGDLLDRRRFQPLRLHPTLQFLPGGRPVLLEAVLAQQPVHPQPPRPVRRRRPVIAKAAPRHGTGILDAQLARHVLTLPSTTRAVTTQ